MIAKPNRFYMTVEEYLELERSSPDVRYEYIDGVVTMLAGGTANHSRICVNFGSQLYNALRSRSCQVFNSDLKVSVSATRYVFPDLSVSCDQRDLEEKGDIIHHPCVVIEVLSPHTEANDRRQKFAYYRACPSVQEYILVSTDEQSVDVYRRATDKLWTLYLFGPGDEVELKSINVRILVAAIYEHVLLPGDTPGNAPA
jgi:Uma2 family endonuclease